MSVIRASLRQFRQQLDDTLQMLRESNARFIKSFRSEHNIFTHLFGRHQAKRSLISRVVVIPKHFWYDTDFPPPQKKKKIQNVFFSPKNLKGRCHTKEGWARHFHVTQPIYCKTIILLAISFPTVYDMPIWVCMWALYRHVIYRWKAVDLSILMTLIYPAR